MVEALGTILAWAAPGIRALIIGDTSLRCSLSCAWAAFDYQYHLAWSAAKRVVMGSKSGIHERAFARQVSGHEFTSAVNFFNEWASASEEKAPIRAGRRAESLAGFCICVAPCRQNKEDTRPKAAAGASMSYRSLIMKTMHELALPSNYSEFLSSLKSKKFKRLWPAQAHILSQYNGFVSASDLAIELPTGAGKTLIALLIAEAWRQAGTKVAILSANKTLARQMLTEAGSLGIPAVLMEGRGVDIPGPDKRAYQRATKVGIMNYWVYFNQKPVIDPADLLIMDDAHLAEHCLHSLFSVEISRYAHAELFRTLVTELAERYPDYSVLLDALADDSSNLTPPELLSFLDQNSIIDRLRDIIDASPALKKDTDLAFRWRRLRTSLREANLYVGVNAIWIRPYIYPLISFPHYGESRQRLYVSATVGEPSDLSRRLGVKQITKVPVAQEHREKTSGRRLVVMNRIEDEDIPARLGRAILTALRIHPKSVWLCAGMLEAEKYRTAVSEWLNKHGFVGHSTWLLSPLGDEIDEFKAASEGHLFVAGRFDGMDFRANECRLVVVTTLPRAIDLQEEFISAYLRDAGFMRRRLNQRIVQALGRCNRSDDDYGIYVLADRRFASHFGRESNREGIPANMIAEIDMAQDDAEVDVAALSKKIEIFLARDFKSYDSALEKYREGVPQQSLERGVINSSEVTQSEVTGWAALFASQNYEIAADHFEDVSNAYLKANVVEMGAFQKWTWAKTVNLQGVVYDSNAEHRALELADQAITRGGKSSWFNRMRASLNRARKQKSAQSSGTSLEYSVSLIRAFDEFLELIGSRERFDKDLQRISARLQSEKHQEFCEALETLGRLLGYHAMRPKGQAATDNRWRGNFGNQHEVLTFEAKIQQTDGNAITPTHMGQAHNQFNRALSEFAQLGYLVRGTLITHLSKVEAAAKSSAGPIRIVSKTAIYELWQRVQTLLSLYRDGWSIDDIPMRRISAEKIYPKCPPAGWLIRALDTQELFITSQDLLREWPLAK